MRMYSSLQCCVGLGFMLSIPSIPNKCYTQQHCSSLKIGFKNLPPDIRISDKTIYKTFSFLQLDDIYKCEMAKFMHKAFHRALPICLQSIFVRIDTLHSYPTSSSRNRTFYQGRKCTKAYSNWVSTAGILFGNPLTII